MQSKILTASANEIEVDEFELTNTEFLPGRIDLRDEQLALIELACELDREAKEMVRQKMQAASPKLRSFLEHKLKWIYQPSLKPLLHMLPFALAFASFDAHAGISVWNCYRQMHFQNGAFVGKENQLHMWIPFSFNQWSEMKDSALISFDSWDLWMEENWPGTIAGWSEQFSAQQKQQLHQIVLDGYQKPWYQDGVMTGYALEYSETPIQDSSFHTQDTNKQIERCTHLPPFQPQK